MLEIYSTKGRRMGRENKSVRGVRELRHGGIFSYKSFVVKARRSLTNSFPRPSKLADAPPKGTFAMKKTISDRMEINVRQDWKLSTGKMKFYASDKS